MTYNEFLKSKIEIAKDSGFEINPEEINQALKPHQRDAVVWALRGGKRALFESFGLGKTIQEIEFCYQATKNKGGKALIVLPLGVKGCLLYTSPSPRDSTSSRMPSSA